MASLPTAGDHINFYKTNPDPKFKCDLAFVGGYWGYKATNIEKFLEPARKKFNMKIYGWGGWDNRSNGIINDKDVKTLFSSAKIGPCIHEPHTSKYGIDIPERVFKVPLCGLLAISDLSSSLHKYFPQHIMPMAQTPEEYVDLIDYFLKHEQERINIADKQRRHILKYHTYLNRIQTIFMALGFVNESIIIQKEITKISA